MTDCNSIITSETSREFLVVEEGDRIETTEFKREFLVESDEKNLILAEKNRELIIVSAGVRGPAGSGGGGELEPLHIVAGESISGHMAIVCIDGLAFKADPTNIEHVNAVIGVSDTAAVAGDELEYVVIGETSSAIFVPNAVYWVGENGMLSTTPTTPNAVWMQKIGRAKNSTTLLLDLGPAIKLEL